MVYTGSEIVSLQFGSYSNYIGTHWWNCQEAGFEYIPDVPSEINHDVFFREGQTHRGEVTFTPRLLLVDLKGSLKTLPEKGRLYEPPIQPDPFLPLWPAEKVCVQTEETEPKNEFLQDLESAETSSTTLSNDLKEIGQAVPKLYHLEDSVKSWSDFLRPHLHPRSITVVQEFQHNDSHQLFDTFSQGQAVWKKPRFNEDFTDKVRMYLEEADNLQGFHILMDSFDGFSGLGCAGLQHLRDEYPSKPIVCFPCQPPGLVLAPSHTKADSVRVLNQALAMSSLAELTSMFVPVGGSGWRTPGPPLTLPHLNYKGDLYYHSSAIVAAAVDSVSLLYRLRAPSQRLADVTQALTRWGRVAAALSLRLPLSLYPDGTLLEMLEQWEGPLTQSLTPLTDTSSDQWLQALVMRGLPETRLMRAEQRDLGSSNPAYACRTLAQLLKTYLMFDGQSAAQTQVVTADSPLKTTSPFPHIFDQKISPDGQLIKEARPQHLGVNQVATLAGLHSCKSVGSSLETLHREAKQVNIKSLHQFANSGLESTELQESLEQLLCLSECYSDSHTDF